MKAIQPLGDLTGVRRSRGASGRSKSARWSGRNHRFAGLWRRRTNGPQEWSADVRTISSSRCSGEDAGPISAEVVWKRFAENFIRIRGYTSFRRELAMKQKYLDDVEFHRGVVKGADVHAGTDGKLCGNRSTKAERDAQNRAAGTSLQLTACETIEANRQELSWPDLDGNIQGRLSIIRFRLTKTRLRRFSSVAACKSANLVGEFL